MYSSKDSDASLLDRSREGDRAAFAVLWERHHGAGIAAARSLAPSLDADDLVAEAFAKILELLSAGRGPSGAFRPYLYRTIRTLSADEFRSRELTTDDFENIPEEASAAPWTELGFDARAVSQAFSALSERWQSVLWYMEVEQMPPREVAKLLNLSPHGVSVLASRAREALRSAWVEAHVDHEVEAPECADALQHLQRYQRGKLTAGVARRIEAHLDTCETCTSAAREYAVLNKRLALVLAAIFVGSASPLLLGGFGATPAAAAAIPIGGPQDVGSGAAGSAGSAGSTGLAGSVGGSAPVVGAAVAGAALSVVLAGGLALAVFQPFAAGPATVADGAAPASASAGRGGDAGAIESESAGETPIEATDNGAKRSADERASSESGAAAPRGTVPPDRGAANDASANDVAANDVATNDVANDRAESDGDETRGPRETRKTGEADTALDLEEKPRDPPPPAKREADPALVVTDVCYTEHDRPGAYNLSGHAPEHGAIRARISQDPDQHPVAIVPKGNPPFVDDHGHPITDVFTAADRSAPHRWLGPSLTPLAQWKGLRNGDAADVQIEIQFVADDGRFSPWASLEALQMCA